MRELRKFMDVTTIWTIFNALYVFLVHVLQKLLPSNMALQGQGFALPISHATTSAGDDGHQRHIIIDASVKVLIGWWCQCLLKVCVLTQHGL